MLNKTRFEINKPTGRLDLVYYQRRLRNYLLLPSWVVNKYEKWLPIGIPIGAIISIIILTLFKDTTIGILLSRIIAIVFLIVVVIVLLSTFFWDSIHFRKAVVTEREFNELIPQVKKADLLVWQIKDSTFYEDRFHVVSQEKYDQTIKILQQRKFIYTGEIL